MTSRTFQLATQSQTQSIPPITMIVAALFPELGIGHQGKLPWRLKQEIKYFKNVTTLAPQNNINAVIMGRKTWESIPTKFKPLPSRLNIVLGKSYNNNNIDGVWFYNSISQCLNDLSKINYQINENLINQIFIIGGAQLYNQLINDLLINQLLITKIEYIGNEKPPIDTWLNWKLDNDWQESSQIELSKFLNHQIDLPKDEYIQEGDYKYKYTLWKRK